MTRDPATEAQIRAGAPGRSTWLSANAGSGKTRVLTNRVARLLLEGVPPQNILCLTYTKAAASEMQNRLFQTLGSWAMKPDRELADALTALGLDDLPDLPRARRLFARAIETPGGLKIQTIHSFCAGLLRRFPLEAGITPNFTELDERAARVVQAEVLDEMANGPEARAVEAIARIWSGEDFARLLAEISSHRQGFEHQVTEAQLRDWLGLPEDVTEEDLPALCFDGSERELFANTLPTLAEQDAKGARNLASVLAEIDPDAPDRATYDTLCRLFLYDSGKRAEAKTRSVPPPKAAEALGPWLAPFHDFMERVAYARDTELALKALRDSQALHGFARPFLTAYDQRKARAGWLDFDDLIERSAALLADPSVADWVLYRLDGSLDHILVDEAQDTSPEQWRVIERLTADFATGESARSDVRRTIFVVGDPKQSIYSFQGAAPAAFAHMREAFRARLEAIGEQLQLAELRHSFRSSPAVLTLVDRALADLPGLEETAPSHVAFHAEKPGRVDLWPLVPKAEAPELPPWHDPADIIAADDENVVLARQIAAEIGRMLREETIQDPESQRWRKVEPGDILILVKDRTGGLFDAIIAALKSARLEVAGADVLRLSSELAVKDLAAVLRFLATPEDDLSLAAALRSPLFGLSEGELYALAQPRPRRQPLWHALRSAPAHADVREILDDLRSQADFLRPYDLIDRILTRHGGRARLLARLGPEAEDGIDALLAQALSYERLEVPSLTGFLVWLDAEEVKVKRQLGTATNQIRVMTVHGAKGLEAPIVFLPDTARPRKIRSGALLPLDDSRILWRLNKADRPARIAERAAELDQADHEEWIRLLYVAMTRAGQWLIVAGAGELPKNGETWYQIIAKGLEQSGGTAWQMPTGEGLRLAVGQWHAAEAATLTPPEPARASAPFGPHRSPQPEPQVLIASDLGGEKALAGTAPTAGGTEHGTRLHLLLEHLPSADESTWPDLAHQLLPELDEAARTALVAQARAVITNPALASVFGPGSLAEVELVAPLQSLGARLRGTVDRLVVDDHAVWAFDFKSNAQVPDRPQHVPEGILRQMGAYRAALRQIFPDREVHTAIIWTANATRMDLPDALVDAALARLDAGGGHP